MCVCVYIYTHVFTQGALSNYKKENFCRFIQHDWTWKVLFFVKFVI